MGSVVVLLLIVVACLMAPLYARYIAHTNPFQSNILGTTIVNGKSVQVLQPDTQGLGLGSAPIGPTWHGNYFLGADQEGRDVMARLLYGGRTTLLIGTASALVCCFVAAVLGLIAGYFGGAIDWILSRLFDLVWAFPVYLLAISLAVVLLTSGIHLGPIQVGPGSLLVPILIIALIYIPYVARPLRGQVLSLKEREFIQAAVGVGVADLRIIRKEVLPNILPGDHRVLPADGGAWHADRVGAVVPLHRRPAPSGQLGNDHQRRHEPAVQPSRGGDRARRPAGHHHGGTQPARRFGA